MAGNQLSLSTVYLPQTNGLVKRTDEVVEAALRQHVSPDLRDWNEHLPFVEYALNSACNASLQSTPFRMDRFTVPLDPFQALIDREPEAEEEAVPAPRSPMAHWLGSSRLMRSQRTMAEAQVQSHHAQRCVEAAKSHLKAIRDRHAQVHVYEACERVCLNNKHLSLRHPSMRGKLLPRYWGALEIEALVGKTAVRFEDAGTAAKHPPDGGHCTDQTVSGAGHEGAPCNLDGEVEFELEAVVNHHLSMSRRQGVALVVEFQARWKGSFDDSWHELADFRHSVDTLCAYLNTLNQGVRERVLKAFDAECLSFLPKSMQKLAREKSDCEKES